MPGKVEAVVKYATALRYLADCSKIIQWYVGCSFFDKRFLLQNRVRKNTDDMTRDDDGKIQKRKEEMNKFNTKIRKYLESTVLRQLNAGYDQLVKRLNKGYAQLQAKKQDEGDKKERKETGRILQVWRIC